MKELDSGLRGCGFESGSSDNLLPPRYKSILGIAAAVQKVLMVMAAIRKRENINARFLLHAWCCGSTVHGGGAELCYCSSVGRFMQL